jgi:hypothetical protein
MEIPNFPGYLIGEDGSVMNVYGELRRARLSKKGYLKTDLYKPGDDRHYTIEIHRLLALAYIPNNDPDKYIVDHINRNKLDNRLENLRWVSASENRINSDYIDAARARAATRATTRAARAARNN